MKLAPWREVPLTAWLVLPAVAVFAVGLAEFVLGCLVLSFAKWGFIQRTCLAVFAGYIGVLLLQLSSGETACQCLGSRSLPLLWMIGLDSLLLVAIWGLGREWRVLPRSSRQSASWELFTGIRLAIPFLSLAGIWSFGSLDAGIAYMGGVRILPTVAFLHVGQLSAGEMGTAQFELTNFGSKPVHIMGAKSTCKCVALDDLPLTISAGESRRLRVRLEGVASTNAVLQREAATLVLDDPSQFLTLSVTATVVPSPLSVLVSAEKEN